MAVKISLHMPSLCMDGGKRSNGREMLNSLWSTMVMAILLFICASLCGAATVVDVYRLIQYDLSGVPLGSRFSQLNRHAGSMFFSTDVDLSPTVLILPLRDVNLSLIRDCILRKQPLGGLLFLLPRIFHPHKDIGGDNQMHQSLHLRSTAFELEQLLINSCIQFAVYFAFEDDNIEAVLADVKKSEINGRPATATTGGYKLVAAAQEPKKLPSPMMTNIQGWLWGSRVSGDSSQLPTIVIVASYDTFGAASDLSVGSDSSGSGVVVLLEMARLFSILYGNPKTRGRYNLLFGLMSGGPYNHDGTQKWLRSLDLRVRESIEYAICLNHLGFWDDELWVHVSKPPENAIISQIFERFSESAKELGIKVGLKHKKINISNSRIPWEHEQFSRLRVTAATLSELSTPPRFLEGAGGFLDSRHFVTETALIRSVKLVAESIARHVYGSEGQHIKIFADNSSLAVSSTYISCWMDFLSRTPRVLPFLSKSDPFILALKKEMTDHLLEVAVHYGELDSALTFFDSTKTKLEIFQVAGVMFDLLLLLVLGSYLILLYVILVIVTQGVDDLVRLFRRPAYPSRKAKAG